MLHNQCQIDGYFLRLETVEITIGVHLGSLFNCVLLMNILDR